MRIVVLTSSRADYGIYLPLLKRIKADNSFALSLIVFGTHLSRFHGYTIDQINAHGFDIAEQVESLILGDTEEAISNAIGNTIIKFSSVWSRLEKNIDLVLALGDRYEMFAAVSALVPFNKSVAHLHGGETTLGAIDNTFRHAITLMSKYHFVSTSDYATKVSQVIGSNEFIYNVGALSLENCTDLTLLSKSEFKSKFDIDISKPTILTTFHPETVSVDKNIHYADTLCKVFSVLSKKYQIVITMPNVDTMGSIVRKKFKDLILTNSNIIGVENFGTLGYFSCMKHCAFLLGNTSSGIIEAASFNKYVINIGDRQKGRATSDNVINIDIDYELIIKKTKYIEIKGFDYTGDNIYYKENSSDSILKVLNSIR